MYAVDDIAALMKSVMEDATGAAVALRNEQPVAHVTSLFPALIYCNIWLGGACHLRRRPLAERKTIVISAVVCGCG